MLPLNVFDLEAKVTLNTNDYEKNLKDASDQAVSFADVFKANILSSTIYDGLKSIGGAIKSMAGEFIQSASSVKAENSQFEQTFGEFQSQAVEAIGRVSDEAGILDTRFRTLGSQIYAFARSSGGEAEQSLGLMERALRVAADSAAYYDTSVENTTETLQSFLKGNYENDAALGLSATETTRNAAAMELFGQKFADLSEIQKQETLLSMVEDAQALSGAMGQASREADSWENVTGNLSETWRQFQANVGIPFLEALIPIVQNITTAFQGWMDNVDWEGFGNAIDGFIHTLLENGPTIISVLSGIGAGFLAWNIVSLVSGISGIVKGATSMATVFPLVGKAMSALSANPIGIVLTAVSALSTAVITLWNTNEGFRNAVTEIWNQIQNAFETVVNNIKGFFSEGWAAIQEIWNRALPYFQGVWEAIQKVFSVVASVLGGFFQAAWSAIQNVWDAVADYFRNLWNTIKGIFSVVEKVLSGDFKGAWEAIQQVFAGWKDFFRGLWEDLTGVFAGVWEWFVGVGEDIVNGIWQGIRNIWNSLVNWFNGIWNSLFGNRKATVEVERRVTGSAVDGSHAAGLDYVPWDGYIAQLHKGEMVLTQEQANALRNIPLFQRQTSPQPKAGSIVFGRGAFAPGAIVIHTQATDGRKIYQQLVREMETQVRQKQAAYGRAAR